MAFLAGGVAAAPLLIFLAILAPAGEIACLVSGARSSAVVVAAAPSALFDRQAATLQRAVSSFAA